jgi:hypothetical protein
MDQQTRRDRLAVANTVLRTLGNFELSWQLRRGFCITWQNYKGETHSKRWACDRGSFYPQVNTGQMGIGGTHTTAISQLVRYCQGRPCLPLNSWRYWGGKSVMLWRDLRDRDTALSALENSDYPKTPVCVFCGGDLAGQQWDWYSLRTGVEGCGCWGRKCQDDQPDNATSVKTRATEP